MSGPSSREEYLGRFAESQRIEGFGPDTTLVLPCPFCAAPDFQRLRPAAGIVDDEPTVDEEMGTERTCGECGRSGRSIVERDESGVRFEFVQTGGPDPDEWLAPPPRRVPDGG